MTLPVAWHPDPGTTSSPYIARQARQLQAAGTKIVALQPLHLAQSGRVVHIHWPEHLARSHSTSGKFLKPAFAALVIALLRGPRRAKVVWTVHNLQPHRPANNSIEQTLETALFAALAQRADVVITLVGGLEPRIREHFAIPASTPVVHIPEGTDHPPGPPTSGPDAPIRFLAVGALLPYKGYVEAVRVFEALPADRAQLTIVGHASDPDVASALAASEASSTNINIVAARVSDAELAQHRAQTTAVLVPNRQPFNSGTPYWALSNNLPVVMVESSLASELAAEFGDLWVHQLAPDFDHTDIEAALTWARQPREPFVTTRYDWDTVTAELREVYEN